MSRPLRIEFDGAWYHVMNRGLGRRNIVRSDQDRRLFFDILGEAVSTFSLEVHAFSLMDNHYHLLIHTPYSGLSRAMRHLNGVYTQRVNKHWKSDGSLFRGRYKAILVESDEYLLELVRYIHLNPVAALMCKQAKEHPWTSHAVYLERKKSFNWLVTEEVLSRFGRNKTKALQELDSYVESGVPEYFKKAMDKGRNILGTKGFGEWVYQNFVDKENNEIPLKQRKSKPKIPIQAILQNVGHVYNVPVVEIRKSQPGKKNEARSMAVYLIRQLTGLNQKEIAKWLNVSQPNAVAQMQYRFHQRLLTERKLKKITDIATNLILSTVKT